MEAGPITIEDMDQAGFEAYVDRTIPSYASEGARATGMTAEAALSKAREQFATLLPEGVQTPGQHFQRIRARDGTEAGILWFATPLDASPSCLFLYDIVIAEDRRGEGLGTACMHWLEDEARRRGAQEISLHVFAHNVGAIRLYERLGFVVALDGETGKRMTKTVRAAS